MVAKKSAAGHGGRQGRTAVPHGRRPRRRRPGELAVRPGEDPWTPEEVAEARTELTSEIMRLRSELEASGRRSPG